MLMEMPSPQFTWPHLNLQTSQILSTNALRGVGSLQAFYLAGNEEHVLGHVACNLVCVEHHALITAVWRGHTRCPANPSTLRYWCGALACND